MKRLIGLILLLAAIPVCGYLSGAFATWKFESDWAEAVSRDNDRESIQRAKEMAPAAVRAYCEAPDERYNDACAVYANAGWLRTASVGVLAGGLTLLGVIFLAARLAARDRKLLLKLFAPGTKAVLIVLFALILAQGAIATYGVYLFEALTVHRVHFFIIGLIGLGALLGACSMLEAGFTLTRRASTKVLGKRTPRDVEPALWALVEHIARRLDATPPNNIVIGLEPNFYVTSADVEVNPGRINQWDETLYLSLPLMRTLSRAELTAVIGHELAHFRGEDTRFSLHFYPIYAGTAQALEALRKGVYAGARGVALLPALGVLSFFMEQFAQAERRIGRDRELLADQAGASVASAAALATALLKVGAFTRLWDGALSTMVEELRQGHRFTNLSQRFAQLAGICGTPELVEEVAAATTAHPVDTHPPTAARIEALGLSAAQVRDFALMFADETSSVHLLSDPVALEEELTEFAHRSLFEQGAVPAPQPAPRETIRAKRAPQRSQEPTEV